MTYKVDITKRLEDKKRELEKTYPNKKIIKASLKVMDNTYSKEEELSIIDLKRKGVTDKEISNRLNRTYWGIVDKIRRLRKEGRF
jgi:DNA-binding NarL/FixJ family response regulator